MWLSFRPKRLSTCCQSLCLICSMSLTERRSSRPTQKICCQSLCLICSRSLTERDSLFSTRPKDSTGCQPLCHMHPIFSLLRLFFAPSRMWSMRTGYILSWFHSNLFYSAPENRESDVSKIWEPPSLSTCVSHVDMFYRREIVTMLEGILSS